MTDCFICCCFDSCDCCFTVDFGDQCCFTVDSFDPWSIMFCKFNERFHLSLHFHSVSTLQTIILAGVWVLDLCATIYCFECHGTYMSLCNIYSGTLV